MSNLYPDKKRIFLCIIDDTPEVRQAVRYTARRALKTGAEMMMLGIVPPLLGGTEMIWEDVQSLIEHEDYEFIAKLCEDYKNLVFDMTGLTAYTHIVQDDAIDAIQDTLERYHDIKILILGTGTGDNPGPIIHTLINGNIRLNIPVTLVPGGLQDEEIDALT